MLFVYGASEPNTIAIMHPTDIDNKTLEEKGLHMSPCLR